MHRFVVESACLILSTFACGYFSGFVQFGQFALHGLQFLSHSAVFAFCLHHKAYISGLNLKSVHSVPVAPLPCIPHAVFDLFEVEFRLMQGVFAGSRFGRSGLVFEAAEFLVEFPCFGGTSLALGSFGEFSQSVQFPFDMSALGLFVLGVMSLRIPFRPERSSDAFDSSQQFAGLPIVRARFPPVELVDVPFLDTYSAGGHLACEPIHVPANLAGNFRPSLALGLGRLFFQIGQLCVYLLGMKRRGLCGILFGKLPLDFSGLQAQQLGLFFGLAGFHAQLLDSVASFADLGCSVVFGLCGWDKREDGEDQHNMNFRIHRSGSFRVIGVRLFCIRG